MGRVVVVQRVFPFNDIIGLTARRAIGCGTFVPGGDESRRSKSGGGGGLEWRVCLPPLHLILCLFLVVNCLGFRSIRLPGGRRTVEPPFTRQGRGGVQIGFDG